MKIHPECIPCLFDRAKFECDLAFGSREQGKLEAMVEIAKYASEKIDKETVPALIGTYRGRIISKMSGVKDPYERLKDESNQTGEEILPVAIDFYEKAEDRVLALLKIAAAANSMEYGVRGHIFDEKKFREEFMEILEEDVIGDVDLAKTALNDFSKVLYLLDNAGEVVLDRFVIGEMEKWGKAVVVSPKSEAIINDITERELAELGFDMSKVVSSGSYVGISLEEAPKEFLDILFDPEYLILAKGMGNYETLSEHEAQFKGRLLYVFRAKCLSVAESVGVKKGTLVITRI